MGYYKDRTKREFEAVPIGRENRQRTTEILKKIEEDGYIWKPPYGMKPTTRRGKAKSLGYILKKLKGVVGVKDRKTSGGTYWCTFYRPEGCGG